MSRQYFVGPAYCLPVFVIALIAIVPACGGKVVVDGAFDDGEGGADAGSTNPPLVCGQEPTEGKTVIVCVSIMDGDFCPPAAGSPGLVAILAKAMGVCAETSPTACCNQPAIRQAVCDLAPNGNECCYTAHYLENVICE